MDFVRVSHVSIILLGALLTLWISRAFNSALGDAGYMDEIFHIPQAQAYCRFPGFGLVKHDPKITTFPGLYWISAGMHALVRMTLNASLTEYQGDCSAAFLRSVNLALGFVGAALVYGVITHVGGGRHAGLSATLVTAFPIHAFFVFLYYSDTASTVFVLATWLALLRKQYTLSGILSACAILMRQTNAVWTVYLVLYDIIECSFSTNRVDRGAPSTLRSQITTVCGYIWNNIGICLSRYGLHATSVLVFVGFTVWNGGIVVGDKENHIPVRHWAQPFYFYAFLIISTLPMWLGAERRALWAHVGAGHVVTVMAIGLAAWKSICDGTLVHPFILADNRHYIFYLWKRIIGRSTWSRFYGIPIYTLSAWLSLASSPSDRLKTILLTLCTATVLIPAHLVEFRYYTIPWYLHVLRPGSILYDGGRSAKLITLAGYLALNAVTMYVFLNKSFVWEDGSIARFMW
jgi:alpha-1,2-glucosyltransferase